MAASSCPLLRPGGTPAPGTVDFGDGQCLVGQYRVVRYMPRRVVGLTESEQDVAAGPEDKAGGRWDAASWTSYPIDREVADLHTVADAAGVGDFVLAGYSGMAAMAGSVVPFTERAKGLMAGVSRCLRATPTGECRVYDYVGGAAIARRISEHAGELRARGFQIIELEGQDHIGALAEADLIAPQLSAALGKAGW